MEISSTQTVLQAALSAHYGLERELGRGGMATVYLARDLRHRRQVAIKVLHPEIAAMLGPDRFLREIELTASLQHPHILALFDSGAVPVGESGRGEGTALLYYVMPFVDGETLRARLDRERQLPVDAAVQLAREMADALAYAHAHGVIHRDVKPENVLLQGGHALVADFGVALAVQHAGGGRMTQTGISLGTPQYMAPEQATGEKTVDHRADVYSLGVVLYEMLAGAPPFTAPTVQGVVARLLTEEPARVETRRRAVPLHVADAVHRALEKLPADRFESAGAFAMAVSAPDAGHVPIARRAGSRGMGMQRFRRLHPMVATVAAVTALAAAAAAGWAIGRASPSQSVATAARGPVRFLIEPDSGYFLGSGSSWYSAPVIAPDGQTVVYAASGPRGARLYARGVGDLTSRPLNGTEGGDWPFFSPNGEWVGFVSRGTIRKVRLDGGSPVIVGEIPSTTGFLFSPSWMPDDEIIYSVFFSGALYRVPASGGRRGGSRLQIPRNVFCTRTHYRD